MPPQTTSRGSALLLLPPVLACLDLSLSSFGSRNGFSISTCIHGVSSRKRRYSVGDKNGLFLSCHPLSLHLAWRSSISLSLPSCRSLSFTSFTARLPGDLTNRLIRSSSQIPLFVHIPRDALRDPFIRLPDPLRTRDSIFLLLRDYPEYV